MQCEYIIDYHKFFACLLWPECIIFIACVYTCARASVYVSRFVLGKWEFSGQSSFISTISCYAWSIVIISVYDGKKTSNKIISLTIII